LIQQSFWQLVLMALVAFVSFQVRFSWLSPPPVLGRAATFAVDKVILACAGAGTSEVFFGFACEKDIILATLPTSGSDIPGS